MSLSVAPLCRGPSVSPTRQFVAPPGSHIVRTSPRGSDAIPIAVVVGSNQSGQAMRPRQVDGPPLSTCGSPPRPAMSPPPFYRSVQPYSRAMVPASAATPLSPPSTPQTPLMQHSSAPPVPPSGAAANANPNAATSITAAPNSARHLPPTLPHSTCTSKHSTPGPQSRALLTAAPAHLQLSQQQQQQQQQQQHQQQQVASFIHQYSQQPQVAQTSLSYQPSMSTPGYPPEHQRYHQLAQHSYQPPSRPMLVQSPAPSQYQPVKPSSYSPSPSPPHNYNQGGQCSREIARLQAMKANAVLASPIPSPAPSHPSIITARSEGPPDQLFNPVPHPLINEGYHGTGFAEISGLASGTSAISTTPSPSPTPTPAPFAASAAAFQQQQRQPQQEQQDQQHQQQHQQQQQLQQPQGSSVLTGDFCGPPLSAASVATAAPATPAPTSYHAAVSSPSPPPLEADVRRLEQQLLLRDNQLQAAVSELSSQLAAYQQQQTELMRQMASNALSPRSAYDHHVERATSGYSWAASSPPPSCKLKANTPQQSPSPLRPVLMASPAPFADHHPSGPAAGSAVPTAQPQSQPQPQPALVATAVGPATPGSFIQHQPPPFPIEVAVAEQQQSRSKASETTSSAMEELEARYRDLEAEHLKLRTEKADLEETLRSTLVRTASIEADNSELRGQVAQLMSRLSSLEERMQPSMSRVSEGDGPSREGAASESGDSDADPDAATACMHSSQPTSTSPTSVGISRSQRSASSSSSRQKQREAALSRRLSPDRPFLDGHGSFLDLGDNHSVRSGGSVPVSDLVNWEEFNLHP